MIGPLGNRKISDVDGPKYGLIFYLLVEQIKNYFHVR